MATTAALWVRTSLLGNKVNPLGSKVSFKSIWEAYGRLVIKYPWRSQITQTAVLLAAGDVISQMVVERRNLHTFEWTRVGRFFVLGCMLAPVYRVWYVALDKMVKATGTTAVLKKVFLDQIVYAPPFLAMFVVATGMLQMQSKQEIESKLKSEMPDIMRTNYQVWPATQFLNFYLVPLHHRILVINIVGLFWNTYMAFMTNKDDSPPTSQKLTVPPSPKIGGMLHARTLKEDDE